MARVPTSTVYDIFDCIFECRDSPSCFSVNLAASKGEDGKLWCDLLSPDKYREFREYNENMTSHHFFTMVGPGLWYTRLFTTLTLLLYTKSSHQVSYITMNYFFLFSRPALPCRVKTEVPVWRITIMGPLNATVAKDSLVNILRKVDCQCLKLC